MPVGPFGEILGTTECLKGVSEGALKAYKSKVQAPKNPKVVKDGEGDQKLTPSLFMFRMSMDTAQKLANTRDMHIPRKVKLLDMSETTHQKFSSIVIDEPLFQPFPSEVFFQKFEPFNTYEVPLILRNQDKVPRLVKVVPSDSPYFKVIAPLNNGEKVGPGLPTIYKIQFRPEDLRDYEHELVCITERERFIVPIRSIGSRALLDFPDSINFSNSPVKHTTTRNLLVRNVGNREAKYTLSTSKPFSVSPGNGTLPPNESMQVSVDFRPASGGECQEDLIIHYDTGEDVLVGLTGLGEDVDIRLDATSMKIDDTYVGMANQKTVRLTNRTGVIAHFRWTRFATEVEENSHRNLALSDVGGEENRETAKFLDECVLDPTLRDKMSILTRTFQNRRQNIGDDSLLFSDDVVKIEPSEGDVWPHSSADISVVFRPERGDNYTRAAFCDVTGRESRLPLRMSGRGMGPKVEFSYDCLDMGDVFVGSSHVYEVLLANKGDIEAIYSLVRPMSAFGRCFTFTPPESLVEPGAHQVLQVRFTSKRLGDFSEEFLFQIDGASDHVKVTFTGSVIGPTFHFDVAKLKFGTVSYGFLNTRQCTLVNTSLVPMKFKLRVAGHGLGEGLEGAGGEGAGAGKLVREFEVTPCTGTLDPQSQMKIQVDFCSTTLKTYETSLVVDVEGVGEQVLSIPILARSIVPAVTVTTPILDYARCFLRHPYQRTVNLQNDTELPVRYELLPQQPDPIRRQLGSSAVSGGGQEEESGGGGGGGDDTLMALREQHRGQDGAPTIVYHATEPRGVIQPLSTKKVELTIEAQGVEELDTTAYFRVVGSEDSPMPVTVTCVGEGPVVHVAPLEVDFGQIPVLTDVTRVITLSNESPISAKFTAHMVRPNSVWVIEPRDGEIPAEESFDLSLTARVDDCVRFLDKLQINVLESLSRVVPVHAYGFGTTIVASPKLGPFLDLGPCFSSTPCTKIFRLTNQGRRLQQLVWSTDGFALVKPRRDPLYNERDIKYKNVPSTPQFLEPVFKLSPSRLELRPGESAEVVLQGEVSEPREVKERLVCHGIIGRQGGKEVLMKVDLRADFISPLLEFSRTTLFFRLDKHPDTALEPQVNDLHLSSVSSLPLNVSLKLPYPFSLILSDAVTGRSMEKDTGATTTQLEEKAGDVAPVAGGTRVQFHRLTLAPGESRTLELEFDPKFKDDLHCRSAEELLTITYDEHPHVDTINLRGEVYFPNLTFEKQTVDFGCILNDTEVTRYINVTNTSPLEVSYHWMFLVGPGPAAIKTKRLLPASMYGVDEGESEMGDMSVVERDTMGQEIKGQRSTPSPLVNGELDIDVVSLLPGGESVDKLDTMRSDLAETEEQRDAKSPVDGAVVGTGRSGSEIEGTGQDGTGAVHSGKDGEGEALLTGSDQHLGEGALTADNQRVTKGEASDKESTNELRASHDTQEPGVACASGGGGEMVERMLESQLREAAAMESGRHTFMEEDGEENQDGSSRPKTRMGAKPRPPVINAMLRSLMEGDREDTPVGVEEVFDILPLYGTLKPGETEQVTMTFYGHADIGSEARALCEVEGGPTYEIQLVGEASLVEYRFDATEIDYGKQMYDQPASAEIKLHNTGRVGFEYRALGGDGTPTSDVLTLGSVPKMPMGVPVLTPPQGFVEAGGEQTLTVRFLPGVPDQFDSTFLIQVAHFEPEKIRVFCEGLFPLITLDLPRPDCTAPSDKKCNSPEKKEERDSHYRLLYEEAVCGLKEKAVVKSETWSMEPGAEVTMSQTTLEVSEAKIQAEMDRLVVKEFSLKRKSEDKPLSRPSNHPPHMPASKRSTKNLKKVKTRPVLPDYLLDFGYVIAGTVRTHVVRVTNTGHFPVSFSVDHSTLYEKPVPGGNNSNDLRGGGGGFNGFVIEIDRVRQLPGYPDHESMEFIVSFDPRGAHLPLGPIEAICPLNIVGGPVVNICLRAHVTMPDMEVSSDVVHFDGVHCGNCQIVSIQLYNHKHVRCDWSTLPTEKELKEAASQVDKHTPMHLRRKHKPEKPKPKTFELMPPTGSLLPGQKVNVQVKFMPSEEKRYEQRITVRIAQSSQRLVLLAKGDGLEPQLEFDRMLAEFGPTLPHGLGAEGNIVVKNPGNFPVEFYSVEFDKQYLEEEKILRLMQGWDEYNTLLLPPRDPSERLPEELLRFYHEQVGKLEEADRLAKAAAEKEGEAMAGGGSEGGGEETEGAVGVGSGEDRGGGADGLSTSSPEPQQSTGQPASTHSDKDDNEDKIREAVYSHGVGELDLTPVSESIARHLGVDLSPEGKAARNRRGVAVVVHGPPMSGKTETAVALARRYSAALITIDQAVMDALSGSSSSLAIKRARELCMEAAVRLSEEKQREKEGEEERKAAGLSAEQLAAHNQGGQGAAGAGGKQKVAGSQVGGGKDKHGKGGTIDPTGAPPHAGGGSSSPPPLSGPLSKALSVSASVGGDIGLASCVLPEDILIDILVERFQLSDCHRGVIVDGLETLFCQNVTSAALAILKAFNNRKYMAFVNLRLEYAALKEREANEKTARERVEKEENEAEQRRLEEMDEEEYDSLPDGEKAAIDQKRLDIKKERLRIKKEKEQEKERVEKEMREAEQRRLEEEREIASREKKKKGKGGKEGAAGPSGKDVKDGGKAVPPNKGGAAGGKVPAVGVTPKVGGLGGKGHEMDRPDSHMTHGSGEESDKKKKGKEKRPTSSEPQEDLALPVKEVLSDSDKLLIQRFKLYEATLKDIQDLILRWDRTILSMRPPPGVVEGETTEHLPHHPHSGRKGKGKKEQAAAAAAAEKEKERKAAEKDAAAREKEDPVDGSEDAGGGSGVQGSDGGADTKEKEEQVLGIPTITIDCCDVTKSPQTFLQAVMESDVLPISEEVLDGLGVGCKGPPVPPAANFSVIPYPTKRRPESSNDTLSHYCFVASSPDDPNLVSDDRSRDGEVEEEKPETPENVTPTSKHRSKDKGVDKKEKRKTSGGKKGQRKGSIITTPPPGTVTPVSDTDNMRLQVFRWIVPANDQVVLRLRFQSHDLGQYDQTMNFEIVGTRKRYQLHCRGICAFPSISQEPRVIFPKRKKNKKPDEIVHKKYVFDTETFEFGPLLAGQNRDSIKTGRYPDHTEKFFIVNTSPLDADVAFCFLSDSKGETFLLDPPSMHLAAGEKQILNVYAYPRSREYREDSLVCCIRENPEPIVFKVSCHGCRPDLELEMDSEKDKKVLQFDRVLLDRKATKPIHLKNNNLIPVGWRLGGFDSLGEDFSVSQDSGVVDPLSEFTVYVHFKPAKAYITNKKSIRLEILDRDDQYGIVETHNIHVHAEAYDVWLDISFPKGVEGGMDFGVVRVGEEAKSQITIKSKTKYEIGYRMEFVDVDRSMPAAKDIFTISPVKGMLSSAERPTTIAISFKSRDELTVKDLPILNCLVEDPNIGENGDIIAIIPIKVSVKAVFSKYMITPKADINFGALMVNFRKQRSFTIENVGQFDFKYAITKKEARREEEKKVRGGGRGGPAAAERLRDGSSSGRSAQVRPRRAESIRQDMPGGGQSRLQLEMFTVSPAFGIVLPGGHVTVNVDCVAESVMKSDVEICIDVSERNPREDAGGIPYRLLGEACIPTINLHDIGSIFEEHRIVKNLSVWQQSNDEAGGAYGEDENRFLFTNVIVGRKGKARLKLSNSQKVPCDLLLSVKPTSTKHGSSKNVEAFEVDPPRLQIPAHSHSFVTVTFIPGAMQPYTGLFEAVVDGLPASQAKTRTLALELAGEGNLPRVSVVKPGIRNKKGQPLVLFRKNLVGRGESLPLTLHNEGTLPSRVFMDLVDSDGVFSLKPIGDTRAFMPSAGASLSKHPHTCCTMVNPGEKAEFGVMFRPMAARRSQASIQLTVENNQYEDSMVQIVGEGYVDDITLDNIHGALGTVNPADEEGNMAEDDIAAAKSNHIKFGDCSVGETKTLTFTMRNHSKSHCMRFQWPSDHPCARFSPAVGHIHAGLQKDMSVTLQCSEAVKQCEELIQCQVVKITFNEDVSKVTDWDDRQSVVRWVDVPVPGSRPSKKKIVEVEKEPSYSEIENSERPVDLLLSYTADFSKYKCKTSSVCFKDTLMFQTRVFEFQMTNKGGVQLEYSWQTVMEDSTGSTSRAQSATSSGAGAEEKSVVAVSSSPTTLASPFTIEPAYGTIATENKATFKLKFSPMDMCDYEARLICSIPNMEGGAQGPVVGVKGRSLLPYCHFELADSDYLTAARRNPELRGPRGAPPGTSLDPNTRVIELMSIGIGVTSSVKFHIVNPTVENYSFVWINEDDTDPKNVPTVICHTAKGSVKSGKKAEMHFEFVPRDIGLTESFWKFALPEQNLSVPFLMVGKCREPAVSTDRSHMNFKALLIGHEAVETLYLVNDESLPFPFSFDETSLYSSGHEDNLQVEPMNGVIQPKSKFAIYIYFTPSTDKEVNFNLVCQVKRKKTPLRVNVKAEGYCMAAMVVCEDSAGNRVELSPHGLNEIKLGQVEINERALRCLTIFNSGKFNFDYKWELQHRSAKSEKAVTLIPSEGSVALGESTKCDLAFRPTSRMSLVGSQINLKILHGPSYNISLSGSGIPPGLHFSFHSHDFGASFVYKAGMPVPTATLRLTNRERKDVSVDCLYKPPIDSKGDYLTHDFTARVIGPNQYVDVTFFFYPRAVKKYTEAVEFEINGLSKQIIEFTGQGVEMKIEVANPAQKTLNLGMLKVGQTVKKQVIIVNKSLSAVTFTPACTPGSPDLQDPNILKVTPTGPVTLAAKGGECKVDVRFSPKKRISQFTEEVLVECVGICQPIFLLTGCCQGIQIELDTHAVAFGSVMQRSQSSRKLVMTNAGDIGVAFSWDPPKFQPDFDISPASGYISPGMEVTFEILFHPSNINSDVRYENLKCWIEGCKTSLRLTLTGMCTAVPAFKDQQLFQTSVRSSDVKSVMVVNRTNQNWQLKPLIDGEFWSGADWFVVEPQTTKAYELTYHPLLMTTDGKKHTGTIFFPLPDGNGLLYNLLGTAAEPRINGKVSREVPAKKEHVELLSVNNWLKKAQRFKVKVETRSEKLDIGTSFKGLDYIDVPASTSRDYRLVFYCHRENKESSCKVTFTSESSGEFQYYEVTLKSTKAASLEVISLTTPVRQSVQHKIRVRNPLTNSAVTFNVTCTLPEISLPNQLTVAADSETTITLEFLPLTARTQSGRIEMVHSDLGTSAYDLECNSGPAGPEKALYFRAALGTSQTIPAKFLNFSKQKCEYSCRVEGSPDFSVEKSVNAAPASAGGSEISLDVTYEPCRIGDTRATLHISSNSGGDYSFPLFATALPPKPQGPFNVKAGLTTSITFRNVFHSTTPFTFHVDNPMFHVTKAGDTVRAKKDHRIAVGFDGNDSGTRAPVMGRLVISCAKSAGGQTSAQWVYYLKGITQEAKP